MQTLPRDPNPLPPAAALCPAAVGKCLATVRTPCLKVPDETPDQFWAEGTSPNHCESRQSLSFCTAAPILKHERVPLR
jgi:hypothetical protein